MTVALATACASAPDSRSSVHGSPSHGPRPPNLVIILADDLGYGDLSCFGATDIATPNLDRMAAEGMKLTDFYVGQAVCTASRAALMTGSYPNRVGLQGALNHTSTIGIAESEVLLPEILKARGYATAAFGKWHLGTHPKFWPRRHGFDEFFGLPYSNDNGPLHPTLHDMPALPLIENDRVVATDPDQAQFTRWFTERAVNFIERNKDRPFFLYVPHVMPHVPIFASDKWKGHSKRGLYGDVVEEEDASVGEILAALRRNGLDDNTLVIFFSDNGPFLSYGSHAGSAGPLREGKLTSFEGGMRLPAIVRWPGKVPAGTVSSQPLSAMDILPTFAELAGGAAPPPCPGVGSTTCIDGRSISSLLLGKPGARSPHDTLLFYAGDELQAIRGGDYKLHLKHQYLTSASPPGRDGEPANFANMKPLSITESGIKGIASRHGYVVADLPESLFDLRTDIGEVRDVAAEAPEVVRRLREAAERAREDLGDALTNRKGTGVRPAGKI